VKLLLDAQLPPALARWLRERGHEALAVREVKLRDESAEAEVTTKYPLLRRAFSLRQGYG
jgi:predicted nuclease of predicted toxin-antitoxin system